MPGNNYEFTQPIQLRFNELISGVRSDVAVKVFGDDLDMLQRRGEAGAGRRCRACRGAADVKIEQVAGLPMLTVKLDRAGARALRAQRRRRAGASSRSPIGGKNGRHVFEGDRRFDIVVRLPEALRRRHRGAQAPPDSAAARRGRSAGRPDSSRRRHRRGAGALRAALGRGRHRDRAGPNQISRENGKRRIVVTANVRGRDLGSFVAEAQQAVAEKVKLPAGYWIGWGGQFEQLVSATKRLTIVVPVALLLIFCCCS